MTFESLEWTCIYINLIHSTWFIKWWHKNQCSNKWINFVVYDLHFILIQINVIYHWPCQISSLFNVIEPLLYGFSFQIGDSNFDENILVQVGCLGWLNYHIIIGNQHGKLFVFDPTGQQTFHILFIFMLMVVWTTSLARKYPRQYLAS